jgi:hypothetical protein
MTLPGIDADGIAQTELDRLGNCPVCGALIDMRDPSQVLAHVHDAEIETTEGPGPPCERPLQYRLKVKPAGLTGALTSPRPESYAGAGRVHCPAADSSVSHPQQPFLFAQERLF